MSIRIIGNIVCFFTQLLFVIKCTPSHLLDEGVCVMKQSNLISVLVRQRDVFKGTIELKYFKDAFFLRI